MKNAIPVVTISLVTAAAAAIATTFGWHPLALSRSPDPTLPISKGLVNGKISPHQIYPVRSDIVAIELEANQVLRGKQTPYARAIGDQVPADRPDFDDDWVTRLGKTKGALVGRDRQLIYGFDQLMGKDITISAWRNAENIKLQSPDDPAYKTARAIVDISRKTRPRDSAQFDRWKFAWAKTHVLYLRLPEKLRPEKTYNVIVNDPNVGPISFRYDPEQLRSEVIQVSQIGFRPDDGAKMAFLSAWMGDGGGVNYPVGLDFWLIDGNGKKVFTGKTARSRSAGEAEDGRGINHNRTNVDVIDFSSFDQPGIYRVCVATIGCSFKFPINDNVWREAYYTSVRGLYHQRSSIAIGAPFTTYKRPRAFHPQDGAKIYQSTARLVDNNQGFLGNAPGFADVLPQTQTDVTLAEAWGGYFDAGDWDRRIQHMEVSRLLIEIVELFPDYFASLSLNIPESSTPWPDTIDEARWNIDFFRRLQDKDGGIRGGIQSAKYSRIGETSWQETLPVLAYASDPWSSYLYVAGAAQMATWFESRDPGKAAIYRNSAIKAMDYAERNLPNDSKRDAFQMRDARNLAALAMLRMQGDDPVARAQWHDLFAATTAFTSPDIPLETWEKHDQRDAAFLYLRLPETLTQPELRANIERSFFRTADRILASSQKSAHRWAKDDDYAPIGWGNSFSTPKAITLLRAHYLSNDDKYLVAATTATFFGAGANPLNMSYTTGIGQRSPRNPLIVDQRITGQAPPPGITVYGPMNPLSAADDEFMKLLDGVLYPSWANWPTAESYYDVFPIVGMSEFTVMQTIAPNAYTWGYLAARAPRSVNPKP
jgi:endoglucanase